MAPHSSTLAWKIPWTEEPCRLQSMGSPESDTTKRLHFHFSLSCIWKGNGNPLQCSCLENPRDGRAWWAAVYGVAQSRTRLKWLSSSSSYSEACGILVSQLGMEPMSPACEGGFLTIGLPGKSLYDSFLCFVSLLTISFCSWIILLNWWSIFTTFLKILCSYK